MGRHWTWAGHFNQDAPLSSGLPARACAWLCVQTSFLRTELATSHRFWYTAFLCTVLVLVLYLRFVFYAFMLWQRMLFTRLYLVIPRSSTFMVSTEPWTQRLKEESKQISTCPGTKLLCRDAHAPCQPPTGQALPSICWHLPPHLLILFSLNLTSSANLYLSTGKFIPLIFIVITEDFSYSFVSWFLYFLTAFIFLPFLKWGWNSWLESHIPKSALLNVTQKPINFLLGKGKYFGTVTLPPLTTSRFG